MLSLIDSCWSNEDTLTSPGWPGGPMTPGTPVTPMGPVSP